MSTGKNQVYEKLHHLSISTLADMAEVYSVRDSDLLENVVKFLSDKKIHSCPVLDSTGSVLGMIDMLDVVSHAVLVAPVEEDYKEDPAHPLHLVKVLEMASRALTLASAKDVINKSGKDAYVPLDLENEVTLALDMFSSGIHRTPVVNGEGKLVGTISQTKIIQWFNNERKTYLKAFPALSETIRDLGLGQAPVVSVKEDDSVVKVLQTLKKSGVSALPVVNDKGQLVATFSAVDLKGLYAENLPGFTRTIGEFLKDHSPSSYSKVGLSVASRLQDVFGYFESHKHQRVWILDHGSRPSGVISYTDIMKFFRDYVQ